MNVKKAVINTYLSDLNVCKLLEMFGLLKCDQLWSKDQFPAFDSSNTFKP